MPNESALQLFYFRRQLGKYFMFHLLEKRPRVGTSSHFDVSSGSLVQSMLM